ncbi:MAG: hypothetical protein ACJAYB_000013 [Psychromonas sp.]|jgi:hypothetical protein
MSNIFTLAYGTLFASVNEISKEIIGMVPSVGMNLSAARAGLNRPITINVSTKATGRDNVPSMTTQTPTDLVTEAVQVSLTKDRMVFFAITGEEAVALDSGATVSATLQANVTEALRELLNEMELDLLTEGYLNACRAYGVPGTTPFATGVKDTAQVGKILKDNGAPMAGKQLVLNTESGANALENTSLTKVNESGDSDLLRLGTFSQPVHGFTVRETGQAVVHTPGTGAGYLVNNGAGYAKGTTAIAVDTGTGTIIPGDIVVISGDQNKYVVKSFAGSVITINNPGLMKPIIDGATVTLSAEYEVNLGFTRNAIQLITRLPEQAPGGDARTGEIVITDERSNIAFEFSEWKGDGVTGYRVQILWGVKAIKPEHIAMLVG